MPSLASISKCSGSNIFRSRSLQLTLFGYLNPYDLTMNKYEVYLPLKYNNGATIEPEKLKQIRQQLMAVFGALTVSSLSAPFQGTWHYGGVEFVDEIIRVEIITNEEIEFFRNFKRRLKSKLRQIDILITMQYIYVV